MVISIRYSRSMQKVHLTHVMLCIFAWIPNENTDHSKTIYILMNEQTMYHARKPAKPHLRIFAAKCVCRLRTSKLTWTYYVGRSESCELTAINLNSNLKTFCIIWLHFIGIDFLFNLIKSHDCRASNCSECWQLGP